MSETTVDKRVRRAIEAFFQIEPDGARFEQLMYTGESSVRVADDETYGRLADKWFGGLRSIFLFLPGTFGLFYFTLATAEFYADMEFEPLYVLGLLFWYFATGFMIYAGVGNLKQVKNVAVPAVVVALALGVVLAARVLPVDPTDIYFRYSIYIFPFVLVCAKLVQSRLADD